LEQFNIKRRVTIETTAEGILIRRPEGEAHSGEQGASSNEQVEVEEEALQVPSRWLTLWQSVKSRFARGDKQ